ncbi:MAG: hypothetical protein ACFNOP_03725 [Bacteroides sp.]
MATSQVTVFGKKDFYTFRSIVQRNYGASTTKRENRIVSNNTAFL